MSEPFVSAAWKLLFRWRIILCCLGARMLSGGGGNKGVREGREWEVVQVWRTKGGRWSRRVGVGMSVSQSFSRLLQIRGVWERDRSLLQPTTNTFMNCEREVEREMCDQ